MRQALCELSLVYATLFATFPVLACQNACVLQSPQHLELGVRFSTHDPRIIQQASRALERWSEIADMAWHREDTENCSINIGDGKLSVEDEIAEASAEDGSITFARAGELTPTELFMTALHEIGHLLGLQHNPSPESVVYWIDIRGDEVLNESDMRALAARHALRGGFGCNDRQLGKGMQTAEDVMIAPAKQLGHGENDPVAAPSELACPECAAFPNSFAEHTAVSRPRDCAYQQRPVFRSALLEPTR